MKQVTRKRYAQFVSLSFLILGCLILLMWFLMPLKV